MNFRNIIKHGFYDKTHKDLILKCKNYQNIYKQSLENSEIFWSSQANKHFWNKKWSKTLDTSNSPFNQWFVGGKFSVCYNALDKHIDEGYGNQIAIIHDSPLLGSNSFLTYNQLREKVARLAGFLIKNGVEKGDRVLIYMPMIPEAIVGMLASIRIGAIHSLVFGGFGPKELSVRIKHADPKIILTATYGLEPNRVIPYKPIIDNALKFAGMYPNKCLIYERPNTNSKIPNTIIYSNKFDCNWETELANSHEQDCIPVEGESPLYILYTSGTTGAPKGIVRPAAGYAVALKWSMENIYDVKPGEVYWAASDLGWVVGHSYACYGPLLNRNTTIIYEGKPIGTPDTGAYFRVIDQYKAVCLFTAPTGLRAIRREDPETEKGQKYNLQSLRSIFLAGEHCDPETLEWTASKFRVPVIDHWWQTETGWPVTSSFLGLTDDYNQSHKNIPRGVTGKPVPGWNIELCLDGKTLSVPGSSNSKNSKLVTKLDSVDDSSQDTIQTDKKLGRILIKLPLPPGFMSTLWKADDRFNELYFKNYPGYYDTYDAGTMDENNFISVMSRVDDVINVAGHRLSTGAIEEAILENQDLAECAVIAVPDSLKGHIPLALCVPKHGLDKPEQQIRDDTVKIVREVIGPVASLKLVCFVDKLPKTRSGKISRHTMAALAINKPFEIPVTIEDPKVYNGIREGLRKLGYALKSTQLF